MEIKDVQGNKLIDALITEAAVKVEELMKQDSITLSWRAITAKELPLGAYVEHNGVRYSLLTPYMPKQIDEATYEYEPGFHHPVMRWQYLPLFFYSNGTQETDWSLTDNAASFMSAVCTAIFNQTGEYWTYSIASNLSTSATLSFSNMDIFSGLNLIASTFNTEWWYDYANKMLHLSQAGYGSAVELEVGKNIGVPSATESKEGYATRFYVFGSTRNIDQKYNGSNVNSIVNRRLTLNPDKYPNGYIDIRGGLANSQILVKTLVFDDIYPSSPLTISNVRYRLMWKLDDDNKKVQIGVDEQGKPVYDQYAIWYFKIADYTFDKSNIISGKALSAHFSTGPLNGREFELTYHEEGKILQNSDGVDFNVEAGDYEINFIEESTYIIPSMTALVPEDGDSIILFNIKMPQEYVKNAYNELENAAKAVIEEQSVDFTNYSFNSNPVAFYDNNPHLSIGRNVSFVRNGYIINSRVIKLETQLDRPYEQKITIGNQKIKGNTQELKEEVINVNQNVDLLSVLNQSTSLFQQELQRSQKLMQEYMSVALFERVNVGTPEAPEYAIKPVKFKDKEVGIVSNTFITAGGLNSEGGGGTVATTLGGLTNVADNVDQTFDKIKVLVKEANSAEFTLVDYITSGGGTADSIDWSKVINKPDTLDGYGIKDALTFTAYDNYVVARFATNALATTAAQTYIEFWQSGAGYFNLLAGKFITAGGTSSHFVKGDGSLDNSEYLKLSGGKMDVGAGIYNSADNGNYAAIGFNSDHNAFGSISFPTYIRSSATPVFRTSGADYTLIHSGNIADQSVGTANKLAKTVKIWGQDFNGSGNVSGSMTDVMNVTPASAHSFNNGSASNPWSTVYTRYLDTYTGYDLRFKVGGSEQMRLTAAKGCLILGDSSVAEPENCKLWLNGNMIISSTTATSAKSNKLRFLRNTVKDEYWDFGLYSQTTKGLTFFMSINGTDTDIAYLDGNGNFVANGAVTAGQASDRRLKDNVQSMKECDALTVLKALNPVTFQWNTIANQLGQLSGVSDGFIADEYEKLIPNSGRSIWANYRAIDYTRVSSYLVKGWQMHETRLEVAERKIKELEEELKRYRRATL